MKDINFEVNGKSYRLNIDLEFNKITLYEIFEDEDDKVIVEVNV